MKNIKTCKNCAYREGKGELARCSKFGLYCSTSRASEHRCGKKYQGWYPKPESLFLIIVKKIFRLL